MDTERLVGYFDILGTKARVRQGRFDDLEISDFANPPELIAKQFPSFRLAAFSDSVLLSAPPGSALDFLRAINFMTKNWSADLVFVRGGVALGEIIWLDSMPHERDLPNFTCARVYGKALVEAVTLERTSGPGVATFVSNSASDLMEANVPGSILYAQSNVLVSLTQQEISIWKRFYTDWSKRIEGEVEISTHLSATIRLLGMIENRNVALNFESLFQPTNTT
jgi:hypothetical protein